MKYIQLNLLISLISSDRVLMICYVNLYVDLYINNYLAEPLWLYMVSCHLQM